MRTLRELEPFFQIYVAGYVLLIAACLVLLIARRRELSLFSRNYGLFLTTPWRLTTFLIAATGLIGVAPYTGDITWDYFDAAVMSVLTYLTAPWAFGTLYLALTGRARLIDAFIAAILWMTSASWSYDLYLLWRDGFYPVTWAWNIAASSVLYACAGLMWNLDSRPRHGAVFAFREPGWPRAGTGFRHIAGYALPFMLIVGVGVAYFFWTQWQA